MTKCLFAALLLSYTFTFAQPPVTDILKSLEFNMTMTSDARAKVDITQQKAGEGVKAMEALWYRRDKDNSILIVMLAPESDKGVGYLRVSDNFWMYRPNTRTFQHINRDESIGGSNAHGQDFENRKLTELYEGLKTAAGKDSIVEDKLGQIPVYKFPIRAKVNDVDYPRKIIWTRRDNNLELKEECYSSSGTLMQTTYYQKYTLVNAKYVAIKQLIIDEFEKGNKTLVDISGIGTDKLDDVIFTKAYLENLSK
ncbi:MAG: outer membrane lipoprotein-sorting protein [Chitinivibrionales bacterium]